MKMLLKLVSTTPMGIRVTIDRYKLEKQFNLSLDCTKYYLEEFNDRQVHLSFRAIDL